MANSKLKYNVVRDRDRQHTHHVTLEGEKKELGQVFYHFGLGWEAVMNGKQVGPHQKDKSVALNQLLKAAGKGKGEVVFSAAEPTTAERRVKVAKPKAEKAPKVAKSKVDIDSAVAEFAVNSARETMVSAKANLERAVAEMERCIERFDSFGSNTEKANAVNWAIHHLASNVIGSLRIEAMAEAQAKLAATGK